MVFSLLVRNIHTMNFKSRYLKDLKYVNIQSEITEGISGNCVGHNLSHTMLAAMGEYFERETMEYWDFSSDMKGFSLRTGKEKNLRIEDLEVLSDSCGVASHTCVRAAFENALTEFIERQSLIFNYLSKSPGKLILEPEKLCEIPKEYKKFHFFDISLISSCYVVLGFGEIEGNFYIGLGSSQSISKALKKCIKEINQFYITKYIKNNIKIIVKDKEEGIINYNNIFSSFTSEQLCKAYSYLNNAERREIFCVNKAAEPKKDMIEELYIKYKIDPYMIFMDGPRDNLNQTIIKIFDLNWFPNMCPYMFTDTIYNFVEKITGKTLDRNCTVIPFP